MIMISRNEISQTVFIRYINYFESAIIAAPFDIEFV
jgi:hypothetical protein